MNVSLKYLYYYSVFRETKRQQAASWRSLLCGRSAQNSLGENAATKGETNGHRIVSRNTSDGSGVLEARTVKSLKTRFSIHFTKTIIFMSEKKP